MRSFFLRIAAPAAALLYLIPAAHAAGGVVTAVRPPYVLFHDELPVKEHDRYTTRDEEDRITAYVTVIKTDGKRGVARIDTGEPKVGQSIDLLEEEIVPKEGEKRFAGFTWTAGASYGWATVRVTVPAPNVLGVSVPLEMKGYAAGGYVGAEDRAAPWITFGGNLGYRAVSASFTHAAAICGASADCAFRVGYLVARGEAQIFPWPFDTWVRPYLSFGLEPAVPIDRETNAIDPQTLRATLFVHAGAGFQVRWNNEHYVRLGGEYVTRFTSSSTKVMVLGLRLEHGWEL